MRQFHAIRAPVLRLGGRRKMDGILVLLRLGIYDATYRSSIESRPT